MPGELLVGERDELLRRVGNHLVGQIEDEAGSAAGGARNAGVVGLARRIGLGDEIDPRDLTFAGLLDEQVVDLGVPAEAVEIERLQGLQPVEVILREDVHRQGCWWRLGRRARHSDR